MNRRLLAQGSVQRPDSIVKSLPGDDELHVGLAGGLGYGQDIYLLDQSGDEVRGESEVL